MRLTSRASQSRDRASRRCGRRWPGVAALNVRRRNTFEFMQRLSTRQRITLGVGVLMLVVGTGFDFFQASRKAWSWPLAITLSVGWALVATSMIWRSCRTAGATTKK